MPEDKKEHIPENFSVEGLSDPSDQTDTDFEFVCSQIDSLGELSVTENRIIVFVDQTFADGSHLTGHSVSGSEDYTEAWGETEPVRSILLQTADGTEYDYSACSDGIRKLLIKRTSGSAVQKTPIAGDGAVQELSVGSAVLRGTPESLSPMIADMTDSREADQLGVSKLTDTNLIELTTSIQKALSSGAVAPETK